MKLQKDMIKKQIQNVDGVIDEQTKKEFEMVVHKNDILMRDFNKMSYRRIMLQKEYARILVGKYVHFLNI
jgi:type IV secretory pathway VirB4 component